VKTALAALVLICVLAVFAQFVAPYSPHDQDRDNVLRPPLYRSAANQSLVFFPIGMDSRRHLYGADPGKFFLLGTDSFGRDLFARICYGARVSLTVAVLGTILALVAGTIIGLLAATAGSWLDVISMELTNFVLSLPNLFVILALRALFPWEVTTFQIYLIIVSILALVGWADTARVVRSKLLVTKSEDFVQAAIAAGASRARVIWRHLLPALIPFWLVQFSFLIPGFLMIEVTLSFLGAGIREPDASWGNILRQGLSLTVLSESPWILVPGIFIAATALSFNALGEALHRRLDPKTLA
jgi:peptide/nickel transport system permease protein